MDGDKVRYVVDERGERTAVLLDMAEYVKLVTALEEMEAIRAYDSAKAANDVAVPLEEALAEIDRSRS